MIWEAVYLDHGLSYLSYVMGICISLSRPLLYGSSRHLHVNILQAQHIPNVQHLPRKCFLPPELFHKSLPNFHHIFNLPSPEKLYKIYAMPTPIYNTSLVLICHIIWLCPQPSLLTLDTSIPTSSLPIMLLSPASTELPGSSFCRQVFAYIPITVPHTFQENNKNIKSFSSRPCAPNTAHPHNPKLSIFLLLQSYSDFFITFLRSPLRWISLFSGRKDLHLSHTVQWKHHVLYEVCIYHICVLTHTYTHTLVHQVLFQYRLYPDALG